MGEEVLIIVQIAKNRGVLMKKIQKGLFIISLCCLLIILSGCGETKADKEYAKNPQAYVLKELKEKYAIEAEVEKEETKVYNGKNGKI